MKKIVKIVSSLCLCLVIVSAVLFAGCSKSFNVNVSYSAGGSVYALGTANDVKGDNEVEKGKSFQCAIRADSGYYISKVVVNGVAVDMSDWADEDDNKTDGYITKHDLSVSDIQEDKTIVVTFALKELNLTFRFTGGSNVVYENIPYGTAFVLFNKDLTTNGDADLFYVGTTFFKAISMPHVDSTIYVDSEMTSAIKDKLDTIFAEYIPE